MVSRWTDSYLDELRLQGDPPADRVIADLRSNQATADVNRLLVDLIRADEIPPGLPDSVVTYLETTREVPPWTDRDKIAHANRLFGRWGRQVLLILGFAALPEGYCHAKLAQTLLVGSRMASDPKRRVIETSQLLIDVLEPGGLDPDGKGIRTVQKVRLMHAAMRTLIPESDDYDPDWGLPVNQEDLASTLTTFSWLTLDLLPHLGVRLNDDDREAYIHTWRVIGFVLGIREDALIADMADGAALVDAIRRRHYKASEAGRVLAKALTDVYEELLPGTVFDGIPSAMIRDLIGNTYADMVGVPKANWTRHLKVIGVIIARLRSLLPRSGPFEDVASRLGFAMTEGLLSLERGGARPAFSIPVELQRQWGVGEQA